MIPESTRLRLLLVGMITLLIVTTLITYESGVYVIHLNRHMLQDQARIENLRDTLSTVKDAETGQRGYLLTGEEPYLAPYYPALDKIKDNLAVLKEDVKKGDLPADSIAVIDDLIHKKLAELDKTIQLQRDQKHEEALIILRGGYGKQLMEDLRMAVNEQVRQEQAELDSFRASVDLATTYRTLVFVLMVLINLAFDIWAFRRIQVEVANHKAAALESRRQKELLTVTLTSIGDGVIVTDNQARITFMNPTAETLTGWTLPETRSRPLTEVFKIINEESRQNVESPVDKVLRLGIIVGLANHTLLIRKDNSELPIDDSGAPIRDENGEVHGVVLVFRDFSAQKESENDILAAKGEAERANRAKDQFLANLSHELRTPLTPVLATLSAWEASDELPASLKADAQMLRRNVDLEARLVDDLLDLTRITKGKLSLNMEPGDVHDLVVSVAGIVRPEIQNKNIKLTLDLQAPRHYVQADMARLQQVIWNVLKNAVKFTPQHGHIMLRTSNDARDQIELLFTDTGIGMAPETLSRIFVPFDQGGEETARKYGGLGLGMSIAKTLIEAQSGTITANSQGMGKGSNFLVTMPTIETPEVLPVKHSPEPAGPAPHAIRILLVEDHVDTAVVMARLLATLGHDVKVAGSVAEAVTLLEQNSFDLLLSDIGLPDGTGIDLILRIRDGINMPAVAMTGFGMEDDIVRCRDAGFNAHLTKPVNFQKLRAVLEEMIEKSHPADPTHIN